MDYHNTTYDQLINQKIQQVTEYSKLNPSVLIISQIPSTYNSKSPVSRNDSLKPNTPSFKKKLFCFQTNTNDHNHDHNHDHNLTHKMQLVSRSVDLQNTASVNSSQLATTNASFSILKNQTFNSSSIKPKSISFFESNSKLKLTYNAEAIANLIREMTEQLVQLDFNLFKKILEKLKILEDQQEIIASNRSNQYQLSETLWNLFIILVYGPHNWQGQTMLAIDDFVIILLILFESIKNSLANDFSSLELNRFLETRKSAFRSISHLNRFLYESRLPSYDKTIKSLQQFIISSQCELFEFEIAVEKTRKLSPAELEYLDNLTLTDNYKQSDSNRYEMLYRHAQTLQAKLSTMKQVREREDLKNCTFLPTTNKKKQDVLLERLSQVKQQQTHKEEDLSECTFKPKINCKWPVSNENLSSIKGVENLLARQLKGRLVREQKDCFYEEKLQKLKSQNLMPQEQFQLSETPIAAVPLVYVDVKVAKGKTGRLAIRKGDNLEQLVRNFSKTYQLNVEAQNKLRKQVKVVLEQFYKNHYVNK